MHYIWWWEGITWKQKPPEDLNLGVSNAGKSEPGGGRWGESHSGSRPVW